MKGYRVLLWLLLLLVGCQTTKELPKNDFQIFIEQQEDSDGLLWASTATLPISQVKIRICNQPVLCPGDMEYVRTTESDFGSCFVFQLTQRAAIQFYRIAIDGQGRKMVLVFNGRPIGLSLPIQQNSLDGTVTIFPEIDEEELSQMADDINQVITSLRKLKEN